MAVIVAIISYYLSKLIIGLAAKEDKDYSHNFFATVVAISSLLSFYTSLSLVEGMI
jgi:hypothetical protein